MELKIQYSNQFIGPHVGCFISGSNSVKWLHEIEVLKPDLNKTKFYIIGGSQINEAGGLILISENLIFNQNSFAEPIVELAPNLYSVLNSQIFPSVHKTEWSNLLKANSYFFHPDSGLHWLEKETKLYSLISFSIINNNVIREVADSLFIPSHIQRMFIVHKPNDEYNELINKEFTPQKINPNQKPLNILEKTKLYLLKKISKSDNNIVNAVGGAAGIVLGLIPGFAKVVDNFSDKIQKDLEKLEQRNESELDKLLKLLKENPKEALKFSIPVSDNPLSQLNTHQGEFRLSEIWSFLNWDSSGNSRQGGITVNFKDESFNKLITQYENTAKKLIDEGDYQKAAFVYFKLLKRPWDAARVLEEGKLYAEAAEIYSKKLNNDFKAAQCYEKAGNINEAIECYKKINHFESVGDLYSKINQKETAKEWYLKALNELEEKKQYLKACKFCQSKINDTDKEISLLLNGWLNNQSDCLFHYLNFYISVENRSAEILRLYKTIVPQNKNLVFLETIIPFKDSELTASTVKNLGYEILAIQAQINPQKVSLLEKIIPNDKELKKDIKIFKTTNLKFY